MLRRKKHTARIDRQNLIPKLRLTLSRSMLAAERQHWRTKHRAGQNARRSTHDVLQLFLSSDVRDKINRVSFSIALDWRARARPWFD